MKVDLTPTNIYCRFGCTICGGSTDKTGVYATFRDAGGDEHFVCVKCLEAGDSEVPTRLEAHASRLERHAAWLREIAKGIWNVPTPAELERVIQEHELRLFGPERPTLHAVSGRS